jgi:hypothetical protein
VLQPAIFHAGVTAPYWFNTDFNAGVTAGKARSLNFNSTDDLKCPSTNEVFCDGWATTVKSNFNIQEFQVGQAAGEKNSQGVNFTSWSCPAGHSKSFCLGWNQTSCSSEGCGGEYTCLNPNQPKGAKNCPNDRGYKS